MTKVEKTNAMRILDANAIDYQVVTYEVDESDLSATHVAEQLQQDPDQLFKTLVLEGNKTGYFVCIIPGSSELDLKKAALISQNKNCHMIPMKDLLNITGYIRGACSPIGMKKELPTYIEETVELYDSIFISAGKRGYQIEIKPNDLIKLCKIIVSDLIITET